MQLWIMNFLLWITGSLVARVVTSLGLGLISYAALSTLADNLISSAISSYGLMGQIPYALLNLAGFGTAIGIIASAISTKAVMASMSKIGFTGVTGAGGIFH